MCGTLACVCAHTNIIFLNVFLTKQNLMGGENKINTPLARLEKCSRDSNLAKHEGLLLKEIKEL